MSFNLDDYEPVATRLARWREEVIGRGFEPYVKTELIASEPGKWCQFKATLYVMTPLPLDPSQVVRRYHIATGWAEEHATDRGVNSTSHVENCETSAVGRALANAGYAGSDPAKRASREEMSKVNRTAESRHTSQKAPVGSAAARPTGLATEGQRTLLKTMAAERGLELEILPDLTFSDAQQIIQELKKTPKVK